MPHQHPLAETPANRPAGFNVPAVDGITVEQRVLVLDPPDCDDVVFGTWLVVFRASPGNCTAACGLIDEDALNDEAAPALVDEEAPRLVDEAAPPALVDAAVPVVDPGGAIVEVGTLNGLEAQRVAVEVPPAELFVEQDVCVWPPEVAPEFIWA
jgi:hypothetical protein